MLLLLILSEGIPMWKMKALSVITFKSKGKG